VHVVRDAYDSMTVKTNAGPSHEKDAFIPDNLEIQAVREAREHREATNDAGGAAAGGD